MKEWNLRKMTKRVTVDEKEYLNLSTSNFLSFIGDKRIEVAARPPSAQFLQEVAKKTIFKYGVGSCGPRGFYGTVDVHLDLESEIAKCWPRGSLSTELLQIHGLRGVGALQLRLRDGRQCDPCLRQEGRRHLRGQR